MSTKFKNIDDLFKDKFENFEVDPPDYIWNDIKSGMGGPKGNNGNNFLKRGGIAGLTVLLISVGVISSLFLNNSFVTNEQPDEVALLNDGASTEVLFAEQVSQDHDPGPNSDMLTTVQPQEKETEVDNISKKEDRKDKKGSKVRANNPKRNSTVFIQPYLDSPIPKEREARIPLSVEPLQPVFIPATAQEEVVVIKSIETAASSPATPSEVQNAGDDQSADMIRGQADAGSSARSSGIKSDYGATGKWVFGLYFTPEMIIYPSDNQLKNYSYSIDANASFKTGNYFLQSGLGLSRNQEQGNTIIDYNEYMGSYEDVYDVTFDSTANGIVPIYHTETISVYDTLDHVVITPTKSYFTYLQVPLFVGYGLESKRLGWFVKGGPSISFLVNEEKPSSGMSETEARILNEENELPNRISTNWQFILSAGVTYKLGNRISLSMEPMFRYYIKSVYEPGGLNTKHPYSIGLRTGILLSL